MKQVVVIALFLAVFVPFGSAAVAGPVPIFVSLLVFLLKVAGFFVVAALLENSMARLHLFKAPAVTWAVFGLALLSFVFYLAGM